MGMIYPVQASNRVSITDQDDPLTQIAIQVRSDSV